MQFQRWSQTITTDAMHRMLDKHSIQSKTTANSVLSLLQTRYLKFHNPIESLRLIRYDGVFLMDSLLHEDLIMEQPTCYGGLSIIIIIWIRPTPLLGHYRSELYHHVPPSHARSYINAMRQLWGHVRVHDGQEQGHQHSLQGHATCEGYKHVYYTILVSYQLIAYTYCVIMQPTDTKFSIWFSFILFYFSCLPRFWKKVEK